MIVNWIFLEMNAVNLAGNYSAVYDGWANGKAVYIILVVQNGWAGDSCLCIVFSDAMNFSMGSRPSILGDLERHVEQAYGKSIYFKARLRESGERLDTRYITDEELRENIHMDITIED